MEPVIVRQEDLGPLQDLMLKACRPVRNKKSINILAIQIGCAHGTLYQAIQRNRITPRVAERIIKNSQGDVTKEDFVPYVFGETE